MDHPSAGIVTGHIVVETSGPQLATTDAVGSCIPNSMDDFEPWRRSRTLICGGGFRMSVAVGGRGEDPIVGSLSNIQSEEREELVETGCAQFTTTADGRTVCIQPAYRMNTVRSTTGSRERIRLVGG